jgi:hypothetical protein
MKRALGLIPALLLATLCFAQPPDRITNIDVYNTVALSGSVYSKAQPQYDQGPVDAAMRLPYITMQIQPSAQQEADLQQLLKQQQDPKSRNYHKWLTPEQYADRFGLSQNDVNRLTAWLRSQGFSIVQVARGRDWIAFSGTAALVENTFRTQIHYFNVDGVQHFANATEVWIPQALDGIVISFRGMHDFSLKPLGIRRPGPADFFPILARPFYELAPGVNQLAPGDIATIYDITPLYTAGINGTGMKMVVVGQVDVSTSLSDIDNFRSAFGLPANDPQQMIIPGSPNPGTDAGDMGESKLDLEWSGAVARNATILFITAATSANGVFGAAQYAVDQDLAPVISMSYGGCESSNAGFIPGYETDPMQKASSEGITFMASSGDEGAAACDSDSESVAVGGLAVNYPASSPEATGVGGNEFNEGSGTYWGTTNGTNGGTALSYIPEMAWNDSVTTGTGTILDTTLAASGGGASSCGESTGTTCTGGFPKPAWQAGTGVPNDSVRDVPDVAMSASANHDGYIICDSGSCASGIGTNPEIVGGTSASAPVFAGIVTLLNQFVGGTGLGNVNPTLYTLAQSASNSVFHDVTTGTNIVPCTPGTPSGFPTALQCPSGGTFGYNAGVGYDEVTGLGSVDATVLANNFKSTARTATALTSSLNPAAFGAAVTLTATVATTGTSAPTGTVTFTDNSNNVLGKPTLTAGSGTTSTASIETSTLPVGSHSVVAAYAGDANNSPSISTALTQAITEVGGVVSTTSISGPSGPVTYGTSVTFTANVATTSGTGPTGTVFFLDGSNPVGYAAVTTVSTSSGTATFPTSSLTGGITHSIYALYSGDPTNASSKSPTPVSLTVNKAATTATLTAAASSVYSGGAVSFTATISFVPGAAAPTGSVTFNNGSTVLGTATLNGIGVATLTTTNLTAPGAQSVTAVYAGDTNYSGSTSSATSVTVNAATFILGVTPLETSITSGSNATFSLTVTPSGAYTSQITFSCAFSPSSSATCTTSPALNPPVTGPATTTLTISGAQAALVMRAGNQRSRRVPPLYGFWMPMGVAGLFLLGGGKRSKAQALKLFLFAGALLIVVVAMFGCGGGSSSTTPPNQQTQTYTVTITATAPATASGSSAAVTKTENVTLTVNP